LRRGSARLEAGNPIARRECRLREYEFTVVVDLAVSEGGSADASIDVMTSHVEGRGGRVLSVDHWGRRRMAYPIKGAIDGDYIVTRIELPTDAVQPLNDALRIDERVYRHLLVRADQLPPPPPPRAPRRRPEAADSQPIPPGDRTAPAPAASTAPAVPHAAEPQPAAPQPPEAPADGAVDAPEVAADPAPVEEAASGSTTAASPPAESASAADEVPPPPATVDGEQKPAE